MAEVSSGGEDTAVTVAPPIIDANGNCTHHPIIKLQRYNKSTQQWKTILKTCPLCSVRGTTPPRRGERRRRSDMLGSALVSDTISSCVDKEKDTKIQHTSSIISPNSAPHSISSSTRSDVLLPPTTNINEDKINLTQNSIEEDKNDSLSPLESELSLCKQTSNLSVTDTCDITEASTCSGSTTSFQGSSSMGVWRYDSIESSGSGSSRSLGYEEKDVQQQQQQQQQISPLSMPSSNVVCQPCSAIPPPPIAQSKTDSVRKGGTRAVNNSMHSNPPPPPPPRTARTSYRRSSTGTSSSSHNPRGSISNTIPPLSPRRSSYPSQLRQSSLKGGGDVVVCGMSYTCPTTNLRGSYTGQVFWNDGAQVPHGIGTLKYTNTNLGKCEGQWLDGILVDSVEERREGSRRPLPPPPPPKSRPRAHSTQELNMSNLTASSSSGMDDNSSWCQPCDNSSSSTPPSPPSYSPRSSFTGGGSSQDLQFCSPCSPSPEVEQVPQNRVSKQRVSLSPRVEIALPLHFKQQKKSQDLSSSYLTREQEEDDEVGASSSEESDNSLRTYQTRSSKGSRRSSYPLSPDASYRSTRSSRSNTSKQSLRSYSARESKGAIDIIRTMQF